MSSTRLSLKTLGIILALISLSGTALAAQDPCAAGGASNPKCAQAIDALHRRVTDHAAGTAHAKEATRASRPLALQPPPSETEVNAADRIHSAAAHPIGSHHDRNQH
jgi:hypothetical protein